MCNPECSAHLLLSSQRLAKRKLKSYKSLNLKAHTHTHTPEYKYHNMFTTKHFLAFTFKATLYPIHI